MLSFFRKKRQFSPTDALPFVDVPKGDSPVELRSLDIAVRVTGLLAETSQTMVFANPSKRQLEGQLTFPLPDGAAVSGYAIDVEGQLVDGVVVTKKEARRILEAEERKGADPGLIEQAQGNVYRTRIYPIPAQGSRTVKITYVSRLTVEGQAAAYHLPLAHAKDIDQTHLKVEVIQAPTTPKIQGGIGNLSLNRWEDRFVAEATLTKGMPAEDLQVQLPELPSRFTAVENFDDAKYFCVSQRLSETGEGLWTPKRVGILWDASGSRDELDKDFAFLKALFAGPWRSTAVDLRVFRDVIEAETRSFEAGESEALLRALQDLPYDGGTGLAELDLAAPSHPDSEAWLLFSDGLATVGRGLPKLGGTPIYAINSRAASDGAFLDLVSARSGGAALNLLKTRPETAAEQIGALRGALRVAASEGCRDLHLSRHGGRLAITGVLTAETAALTLVGPGAPAAAIEVRANEAVEGRSIARDWAGGQSQVIALTLADPGPALEELGRAFNLVTQGTSLLVLETLEQHLEYKVTPAPSRTAMHREYQRRVGEKAADKKKREDKQISSVLSMWRQRTEWWERDFHAERRPPSKPGSGQTRGISMMAMSDESPTLFGASAAAPMMMESSMPPAEPMRSASMAAPPPGGPPRPAARERRMSASREEVSKKKGGGGSAQASIKIQAWNPDTPYLKKMRAVAPAEAYRVYLGERAANAGSPAFFLDCADHLLKAGERALGLRVLSNLVEIGLDDAALMRRYAWRLQQAGALTRAIEVFEQVKGQRDDEPQSFRDLALALGERWQRDSDPKDAARSMELLYDVILKTWDRFPEIELIALMELNRLIAFAEDKGLAIPERIDPRLRRLLDLDLRISLSWDADLTDVDLHVFEPTGEHAYYGHNRTAIGGLVSRDFTQGYGPEEYVLRRAEPGAYTIKAHYYGSSQQTVCGPCTVIATVFTNYGRPDEKKQVLTLRLDKPSDQVVVGEVTIDPPSAEASSAEASDSVEGWQKGFAALSRGMSIDEITAEVGQPSSISGTDGMALVYEHPSGARIELSLNPKLVSVRRVGDGASIELI